MTLWTLHILNCRHDLTGVLAEIRQASRDAVSRVLDRTPLPDFDLVVRSGRDRSAEGAILGRCPAPGVIEMVVTPERFASAAFARVLVRQAAHLVRSEGAGRDASLGEALVRAGLAGHLCADVLGGGPDACDTVRFTPAVARQAMTEWARPGHDHACWFEGKGDLRRNTGIGLGYRVVENHLAQQPGDSAAAILAAPLEPFRQALRRLAAGAPDEADAASEA